jgi:hypothetical protein
VNELYRSCYILEDIAKDCPGDLIDHLDDILEAQKRISQLINKIDRITNGNPNMV